MTIAEIRVFDQALTAEQVVQDRDGELGNPPAGPFQIISVTLEPGAAADTVDVTITWESLPDQKYSVTSSDDLQGEWTELSDGVDSEGSTTSFLDSGVSPSANGLYYRITLE